MLQRLTNIKSYMIYRTAPFSMTLNNPYLRFQGHAIFDAEYLRNGTIFIARQHTDARYWYSNSVRLSVTFRYYMKTAQHIVIVFHHTVRSPTIPILSASNIFTKFLRRQPYEADKYRCGIKKFAIFHQ